VNAIHCRLLGPPEVSLDEGPTPRSLLWRKNLALLVYLAHSPGRVRTRSHLVGLLWGDKPEAAARHSLNEALRLARRAAGNDAISTRGDCVHLSEWVVDSDTARLLDRLEAEDWEEAAAYARGEFMDGFSVPGSSQFEDWLSVERMAWRRRSVEALVRWGERLERQGDLASAGEPLARAMALDPLSGSALRGRMRVLALSGDRSGALEHFRSFEERVAAELGVEPDPESRLLADRVRRQRQWKLPPEAVTEGFGRASRRAPLMGRADELQQLIDAWTRCRMDRRASTLWIDGASGIGKTRLGEELAARARLEGGVVAAIRSVEADLDQPWNGVLTLARGGLLEAPGLVAAEPAALASFTSRLTEWGARFSHEAGDAVPAPLGRGLSELIRAVTVEQPVLLLIDDAQWMDPESFGALVGVLRDLSETPVCLTFLTAPVPVRDDLDALRARIGRDIAGAAVRLERLERSAIQALVRHAMPNYDDDQVSRLSRRIQADAAGMPLYAVALLHAVSLGLELREEPWPEPTHTMEDTLPAALPDSLVAAVRIGFRRLSGAAQAALAAASVLGDRVALDRLAIATGLSLDELSEALDELEWHRWLTAEPRGYAFLGRIVRRVIERDMVTPGRRRRILAAVEGIAGS